MKKILYFIISISFCNQSFAQYHGLTNFEDSNGLNISIDTSAGNLWQIGRPDKPGLDSAHSLPNAIVTDTALFYPPNNFSSLIIKIIPSFPVLVNSNINFYHKYETDNGHAGGYVEFSLDGKKWVNVASVVDTTFYITIYTFNFYSQSDTLSGGEPAFSGSSNGWIQSSISFGYICSIVKRQFPDSILFRFVFRSDSSSKPEAGWAIDDISVNLFVCSGINDPPVKNPIHISPNPALNEINMSYPENSTIMIYDVLGREIKTIQAPGTSSAIDIRNLPSAIYTVQVTDKRNIRLFSGKFIKE